MSNSLVFTGRASDTHYFVERIERVALDTSVPRVVVQVRWEGRNPSTNKRWPMTWETLAAFEENPRVLLESDTWIEFTRSSEYQTCFNEYPEAFAPITAMTASTSEDPAPEQEVITEWDIAKQETFESVADQAECPVCYFAFSDDSFVSMLACRHVLCQTCFAKWPKCTLGCK